MVDPIRDAFNRLSGPFKFNVPVIDDVDNFLNNELLQDALADYEGRVSIFTDADFASIFADLKIKYNVPDDAFRQINNYRSSFTDVEIDHASYFMLELKDRFPDAYRHLEHDIGFSAAQDEQDDLQARIAKGRVYCVGSLVSKAGVRTIEADHPDPRQWTIRGIIL